MAYSVEEQAEDLLEFATEAEWSHMFPPDCITPTDKVNWCMLNLSRFKEMSEEAPFFTSKVMHLLAEKFQQLALW